MRDNLILSACLEPSVDEAARRIQEALGIATGDVAGVCLPSSRDWYRSTTAQRAMAIAEWLRAEAMDVVDQCTNPKRFVTMVDPNETVGTRD
jgi:hypothetical protein